MKKTGKLPQAAREKFAGGCRCSEAVLAAFCGKVGLDRDTAMKLGCAFGGGLGGAGETCGAVTGAVMILGLRYGRTGAADAAGRLRTDAQVRKFLMAFKRAHKHLRCNDLVGCDRSTKAGHDRAAAAGVFKKLCPALVEDAARILEKLL